MNEIDQLILLLVFILFLLALCFLTSRVALISPQFGFAACFIPGILYAFMYIDKWNLKLSNNTIGALILGLSTFVVVSIITAKCSKKLGFNRPKKVNVGYINRTGDINDHIAKWKIGIIIVIQVITLLFTIYFLFENFGTNLAAAMIAFRRSNIDITSDVYITLPGVIRAIRRMCLASGFIMTYLFAHGVVYGNKKNRKTEIVCIVLTALNGLALGGRGDVLLLIVAGIMQYLFIKSHKDGRKFVKFGDFLKITTIIIVVIATFAQLGELLGRNMMSILNYNEYIAVYLSAELKNLDIFIRNGIFGADFTSSQTMANIVNVFGDLLGKNDWIHNLDNKFRFINGYSLGNVSTIFYAFLYDGGYFGIVIYTSIMAIMCQLVFQRSLVAKPEKDISISIIIYSYVWFTVVFSFFSDKFYEMIFNTAFLWLLLSWFIIRRFLMLKIRLKVKIQKV